MSANARAAGLLSSLVAPRVVAEVAETLMGVEIEVMPLKGAALQVMVYDDPAERALTDVDLLVRPARFGRALAVLKEHGFVRASIAAPHAVTLRHPGFPLPLDLHRSPHPYRHFAMGADAMLDRGIPDRRSFGARVLLPEPYDLYAHVIGHFARSRMDRRNERAAQDLRRIPRRLDLDSLRAAEHLVRSGLSRATRYALLEAGSEEGFEVDLLGHLPPDREGALRVTLARWLAHRSAQPSPSTLPLPHLLEPDSSSTLRSSAHHIYDALRRLRYRDRSSPTSRSVPSSRARERSAIRSVSSR